MSKVGLSIVIVNWNTCALLADCLASVFAYPPDREFDVWVVDNRSSDGSSEMVRQEFPQVKLVENQENVGFAQANNQALEQCSGKFVLLLNPDTEVQRDALDALVRFMDDHPDVGAAGSRLLNPDGSLQPSCYPLPTLSRELWRLLHLDVLKTYGIYQMRDWDVTVTRSVEVVQGASMILRREALQEVGHLDAGYFMYTEEVDMCYRLLLAGWGIHWVPSSQVIHYGGQSTQQTAAKMFWHLYESKTRFFRKHYGRQAARVYKLILAAISLARLMATPLTLLQKPANRQRQLALAKNYARLVMALPGM